MNQVSTPFATEHTLPEVNKVAPEVAASCMCTLTRQFSRLVTRAYDNALQTFGITGSQFMLLCQLAQQDGITAVEIGRAFDIEKSTLSRNLKRLLALQLLTIDPPTGRRGRGLHLTSTGGVVITQAFPAWQAVQSRAVVALGTGTRTALESLISRAGTLVD